MTTQTQTVMFRDCGLVDEHHNFKINLGFGLDRAASLLQEGPDLFAHKMLNERMEFHMYREGKFDFQACTMPGGFAVYADKRRNAYSLSGLPPEGSVDLLVVVPKLTGTAYQICSWYDVHLSGVLKQIWGSTNIRPEATYITAAVKFVPPKDTITQTYVTECRPVLQYEVECIKPRVMLVFGAHALKALGNSKTKTDHVYGTDVATYGSWKARLFYTIPPNFDASPKTRQIVDDAILRMTRSLNGAFSTTVDYIDNVPEHKTYKTLRSAAEVKEAVELILGRNKTGYIFLAVDCEWGRQPDTLDNFKHNKTILIQFTDRAHHSFAVVLRGQRIVELHSPEEYEVIIAWLRHLFCHPRTKLAGHNLKSDILQLTQEGIECVQNYAFDTMTAFHLLKPHTERHGLEEIAILYTDLGRYDRGLSMWLEKHSSKREISECGYAMIPPEVLIPYSHKDVDAVIQAWPRIAQELKDKQLSEKYAGYTIDGAVVNNQYDMYMNVVHRCDIALIEVERNGVPVDLDTLKELEPMYRDKAAELLVAIRIKLCWASFNPSSGKDMQYMLFGLNKRPKSCPATVVTFGLAPVKTTGKYPKMWNELSKDEQADFSPATDAQTLKTLRDEAAVAGCDERKDILELLWRYKIVQQICTQMLQPPVRTDTSGNPVYTSGYIGLSDVDAEGNATIHGTFMQLTQTGRLNSTKPNMNNQSGAAEQHCLPMFMTHTGRQKVLTGDLNLSKVKWGKLVEEGYIDPRYKPVRAGIRSPPGWVLLGADYKQAELFTLACVARDQKMQAVMFNPLLDVHSMIAVQSFRLDVPAGTTDLKKWVEGSGYGDLRSAAKSVIFGIIYGRGASSVLRQIRALGIDMTLDEVNTIIAGVFGMFDKIPDYIENQKRAVYHVGYAENPFGRRRYFFRGEYSGAMKAQERESTNFPIQSTVGDVLPIAMYNFIKYKQAHPSMQFKMVLPYHDAIYLACPISEIDELKERAIPMCMSEQAEIPNIGLRLRTDVEIMYYFGTKADKDTIVAQSLAAVNQARSVVRVKAPPWLGQLELL